MATEDLGASLHGVDQGLVGLKLVFGEGILESLEGINGGSCVEYVGLSVGHHFDDSPTSDGRKLTLIGKEKTEGGIVTTVDRRCYCWEEEAYE